METANLIIALAWFYGGAGLALAFAFLVAGIDRVDPSARGVYTFRPLLLPGLVLLWPVVLWRWIALESRASSGDAS